MWDQKALGLVLQASTRNSVVYWFRDFDKALCRAFLMSLKLEQSSGLLDFLARLYSFFFFRQRRRWEDVIQGRLWRPIYVLKHTHQLCGLAITLRMLTTIWPGQWQPDEPQKRQNSCPWLPLPGWYGSAHAQGTGRSPEKNVCACSGKNDTWSISGNVIGSEAKMPAKCSSDERSDGSFFWQWQRYNLLPL